MPVAVTDRLDSPRILAGTRGELRVQVSQDGLPVAITSPGVVLTNADTGAAITPASAVAAEETGKLVQVLSGSETATPQRIKAAWTANVDGQAMTFTTYHEVVGDVLFTLAQARAWDGGALGSKERYPDATVLEARDRVAEAFEDICGVSFGTRGTRETLDGTGGDTAWLSRMECQAVSAAATRDAGGTTWTALTASELADCLLWPNGKLVRESLGTWPAGSRNVRVDYTHGHARVPLEIREAALMVVRERLTGTDLPRNSLTQVNELGTFRLATPGERGAWFGIPVVDEALRRYRRRLPGVG